jgi:hypothetical protein
MDTKNVPLPPQNSEQRTVNIVKTMLPRSFLIASVAASATVSCLWFLMLLLSARAPILDNGIQFLNPFYPALFSTVHTLAVCHQ